MHRIINQKLTAFTVYLINKPITGGAFDKMFFHYDTLLNMDITEDTLKLKYLKKKNRVRFSLKPYILFACIQDVLVNIMYGETWISFPNLDQAIIFIIKARSIIFNSFKNTSLASSFYHQEILNNSYYIDNLHDARWVIVKLLFIKNKNSLSKLHIFNKSGERLTTHEVKILFLEINIQFICFVFSLIKDLNPDFYKTLSQKYMNFYQNYPSIFSLLSDFEPLIKKLNCSLVPLGYWDSVKNPYID